MIKRKVNRELLEKKRQAYLKVRGQHAVKLSRRYRKTSKSRVKEQQSIYQQEKRTGASQKRLAEVKEDLKQAKETYRTSKVLEKEQLKRVGGSRKAKLARKSYQQTRTLGEATWADNDVLDDIVSSRQKIRQAKYSVRQGQMVARHAKTLSKGAIKGTYHVSNRGYNFVRGHGFTRTAKADRWETKLQGRLNRLRLRYRQSKFGRATRRTKQVVNRVVKWFPNPLTLKGYVISFVVLLFLALCLGILAGSGPVQQDEFDLNQAWLHLSRRDREKSTDKVDYWTNIDDILFYMNFRYGSDWKPSDPWEEGFGGKLSAALGFNRYSDALNDIWNNLNQDNNNLKSMADLYGGSSSVKWLKLDKDDLEDFKEQEELARDIGRYPAYNELANPFYGDDEKDKVAQPLVILKRFGYTSKDDIYEGTVMKADKGQTLIAMMTGKVTVKGKDIILSTADTELTYKDVAGIRVKTGDQVTEGERVGTVASQNGQEFYYRKMEEAASPKKKAKWTYVNLGFYLPEVTYNQTTSVLSDLDFSGDAASRVNASRDYIKKLLPDATDNGMASMFANFLTESNMTAKRAEGDFLAPPIGASDGSWDDASWLSIGGPAIYNGRYPNILRRGLGLGQWTDTADGSIRHTLLLNYAKEKGKKWYDLELQLDFIFNGDTPYYREIARQILTSPDDVESLTKRFLNLWEGNAGDKLLERQNNAKQVLQYFKQGAGKGSFSPLKDSGQPMAQPYTVTQLFGANPNNGIYNGAGHTGLDLAAPEGTPLYAITDGEVVIANGGYEHINGNHIVYKLPNGAYLYYGHMRDVPLVKVGDKLKKGQQVGYVGQTGLVTGPHLHLEGRVTPQWGQFYDPASLIFNSPPFPGQVVVPK